MHADVIVIGAGIAGVSVAARLSATKSVILLEAEPQPGRHATGRSAAYFAPAYGSAVVRRITLASEPLFREPGAFSDVPLIHERASLWVATVEQAIKIEQLTTELDLELLDSGALRRMLPVLKPEVISKGLLDRAGGDLDVDAVMQGFLRLFRANGGHLYTSECVKSMEYNGNWLVTARETFEAPLVINAAGAWADNIAALANLQGLGIQPMRRTAFTVDAPTEQDISSWPLVIDVDEQFYFKPDAGQLLLSPAEETPMEACDAAPDEFDIAVAVDRIQRVADIPVTRVNHKWAGLRSFAPDRNFVVGFDPRADGFFWLAGQGGYGVQTCPGLSDISFSLVTGETPQLINPELVGELQPLISPDRLIKDST